MLGTRSKKISKTSVILEAFTTEQQRQKLKNGEYSHRNAWLEVERMEWWTTLGCHRVGGGIPGGFIKK